MAKKSLAQIRRELRGIEEPPKNPKKVKAGVLGVAVKQAKNQGISTQEAQEAIYNKAQGAVSGSMPKGGQNALNAIIKLEQVKAAKDKTIQEIKKANSIKIFVENSENVAQRLVSLALGQNTFHDAPASVQRLAMIDVLTFAGITQESAEKQAKPVHEMNTDELERFIESTKALIEKHENAQLGQVIEGITLNDGEADTKQ